MKGFEEFWKESERNPEEKETSRRGWDTAYADFQETAQLRFVKGIGPFSNGYNACMRSLEVALEEVIENPLELHIYKMIRATEENINKFSCMPGAESVLSILQMDLEAYKLALKQYLKGE